MSAYILQAIFYQAVIYCFEVYFKLIFKNKTPPDENGIIWIRATDESNFLKIIILVLLFLNTLLTSIQTYSQYLLLRNMGPKAYFKSFYSIIDIIYISLSICITIMMIYQLSGDHNFVEFDLFASVTKAQRNLEAICLFLTYTKASYFMSLIDSTAPLVDSISEVLSDIKFFIIVMLIQIFAFASSFYIIGQNQLQFDEISPGRKKEFAYGTFGNAIWYVYANFVLFGKKFSDFERGEKSQRLILYTVYIAAASYIAIILLNMLIAIMQNTFSERRGVAEQVKIKDHLKFVLDNWHLINYALKDKSSIQYIVGAMYHNDGALTQEQKFDQMKENLKAMDNQIQENFNKLQDNVNKHIINFMALEKDFQQVS